MKTNYILYIFFCVFLVIYSACENKQAQQTTQTQDTLTTETDPWAGKNLENENDPFRGLSLDKKVEALLDSIDIQWYAWNKSDDERNANILALLKELNTLPAGKFSKQDKTAIDSIKTMHQIALSQKLTQENMRLPNKIDQYDNNMIGMVEKLGKLMEKVPTTTEKGKTCQELFKRIRATDEMEFILRKNYDDNVFLLNELIVKEQSALGKLGDKYQKLQKFPVFAIMQ